MEAVRCRYCGVETSFIGSRQCPTCWEIQARLPERIWATKRMIAELEGKPCHGLEKNQR